MSTQEDTHGNLQFSCQELTNKKDLIASIAGFQPHVIHFAGDSDTGRLVMPDGAALAMPPVGGVRNLTCVCVSMCTCAYVSR